jgi:hypothetical protein
MYRPGFLNGVQSIRSLRDDTKLGSSQTARNRFSKARKAIDNQTLKLCVPDTRYPRICGFASICIMRYTEETSAFGEATDEGGMSKKLERLALPDHLFILVLAHSLMHR